MRLDDWPERLSAMIEASRARTALVYGEHDCCTHAADAVLALTGRDIAADWRGQYATPDEGLALAGAKTLRRLAGRFFKPVAPVFAHRGDLALASIGAPIRGRPTPTLLIVDGIFLRGPCGAVAKREHAKFAWRVE